MDMGVNPKDLRINEQIAITYTYDHMDNKEKEQRKDYHFLSEDIVSTFKETKDNPDFQREALNVSSRIQEQESVFKNKKSDREER